VIYYIFEVIDQIQKIAKLAKEKEVVIKIFKRRKKPEMIDHLNYVNRSGEKQALLHTLLLSI